MDDDFASFSSAPTSNIDDLARAQSAFPDISFDGDIPATSPPPPASAAADAGFSFSSFDAPPAPDVKVTGDEDFENFESQFPDIGGAPAAAPPPQQTGLGGFTSPPPVATTPQYGSTNLFQQSAETEETEVMREWREKQAEEIKKRDEAAKVKREEIISKARNALDDFYEDYSKKKERTIRDNKDNEAEFVEKLQSSLTAGTTWERITEIIELQNSQSKTIARAGPGTTDLARYKEVLLRLKREGSSAPGAAGY